MSDSADQFFLSVTHVSTPFIGFEADSLYELSQVYGGLRVPDSGISSAELCPLKGWVRLIVLEDR